VQPRRRQTQGLLRAGQPGAEPAGLRLPADPARAGQGRAVRRRRADRPDRRGRPRPGLLHRPADQPPDERPPDGAVHLDRHAPAGQRPPGDGRHPVLRVRPAGPQGRGPHPDHGQAGREPDRAGRGRPGRVDRSARGPGAGVLRHPGRPPERQPGADQVDQEPQAPEPGVRLAGRREREAGQRLRQHPRRGPVHHRQAAQERQRRPGGQHHRRREGQERDHGRRHDHDGRHDDQGGRDPEGPRGAGHLHRRDARGVRPAGAGAEPARRQPVHQAGRDGHDPDRRPAGRDQGQGGDAQRGRPARRGDPPHPPQRVGQRPVPQGRERREGL
ncbi:MAG: Ribose-phosphate pyrophosphokinase, partial [uncultured Phycisphaerae bacterium]